MQLLRDPARARRLAQPQRRRRARARSPPRRRRATARSCSPASTSAASATAPRATTCRGSCARRGRRPGSSGCGSARSRSTTSTTRSSRRCARRPTVGRHLHVPLQSGDDGVLRAMRRRYTTATYLRRLAPLAGEFNLTSDVIVGFPAEDDAAFERTLAHGRARRADEGARLPVLAAAGHRHRRRRSASRRGVKKERGARLRALSHELVPAPLAAKLGADDVVLVDRPGPRLRRRLLAVARRRAGRRARPRARRARHARRGSLPKQRDDCLFCSIAREGDLRARGEGVRRDQRHQPAGARARARHPRAPRRHVPRRRRVRRRRDEADARVRRRDGGRTSA